MLQGLPWNVVDMSPLENTDFLFPSMWQLGITSWWGLDFVSAFLLHAGPLSGLSLCSSCLLSWSLWVHVCISTLSLERRHLRQPSPSGLSAKVFHSTHRSIVGLFVNYHLMQEEASLIRGGYSTGLWNSVSLWVTFFLCHLTRRTVVSLPLGPCPSQSQVLDHFSGDGHGLYVIM